jgi:polysaccharide biosynthesis/export protein
MNTSSTGRFLLSRAACATGVALAVALSGCSSLSGHSPAPLSVNSPDARYTIGPLDTLNPDLSATVSVRPDGYFSAPLIPEMKAAGKSPQELSQEVQQALEKFVRDPVVSVIVGGFQGVYGQQIRIVGEATRPQAVAYRQNMTLLDVMIQVGGLTEFADGNSAVLVRGAEGGKQYSLRLKDLLKRGDISANAAVLPGDIVIVPQSWF